MAGSEGNHVFISYVREDSDAVDSLCAVLEAAQIPYWRDRSALGPGDAWRAKIRQAIRERSLVFLACFSDNSRAKDKSYMNEELTLAVDEFRQMPPGRTWLIPVRFDSGGVPDWDLGAGRVLSDLNYSDLFGADHMANVARLVTTIHRLMGEKRPDPATALAAVEQTSTADRSDLLKRLTKEMLLDPSRRIELDDLISQEVQRVMSVLNNSDRVAGPLMGSDDERVVLVAREAQGLWSVSAPFCASLQVAARWGSADVMDPWANGLRSFVAAATRMEGGVQALLELRHLPGMVGIMTAAMACVSSRNWENLKVLAVDPTVRDRHEQNLCRYSRRRTRTSRSGLVIGSQTRLLGPPSRLKIYRTLLRTSRSVGKASTTRRRLSGYIASCARSSSISGRTRMLMTRSSTGLRSCWACWRRML